MNLVLYEQIMPSRTFLSGKYRPKKHVSASKSYSSRLRFYQRCLVLEQACLTCHSRIIQLSSTKQQLIQLREETERECEEARRERDKLSSELVSLHNSNDELERETSSQAPQLLTSLHGQIEELETKIAEAKRSEKSQKNTIKTLLQEVRQAEDRLQQRSAYVDQLSKSISQVEISSSASSTPATSDTQLHSYSSDDVTRLQQKREPSLWSVTDKSASDKRWHSLDQKLVPVPVIKEPTPPAPHVVKEEQKSVDISQLALYNTYSDLTSLDTEGHRQGQREEEQTPASDETEDEEILEEMTEKFSLSPPDTDARHSLSNSPLKMDLTTSLKSGCDTQRRVHFQAEAVFLDAALEGEVDVVRTCLRQGRVDIDSKSGRGLTALHKAAMRGSAQVVSLLLEKGADINCQDPDGWTPLHCAVSVSNPEMVRHLVLNGSSLFTPNDEGDTPLKQAYDECEALHEVGSFYDRYSSATATECLHFLLKVQNDIGVINGGKVYAVYEYSAEHGEELSFNKAEQLRVLKRSSQNDSVWWHAMNSKGKKGLVPGNYFTCYKHTPTPRPRAT